MATDINLTPTAGMPPVTTETSGVNTSGGTEGIVPSGAAAAAQLGSQQAAAGVTNAEAAVAPTLATTIEGHAAGLDAEKAQLDADNAERAALVDAAMPRIKAAHAEAAKAASAFENHTFYDLLSNRSTGDKVLSRLAIALNAGANSLLGIPGNELADDLQHRVDQDFERQKIALHSKENIAKWKKEGVTDLYDQLQKELAAVDVKHAKALESVKLKAEAMALRAQIPEAQAKQNVVTAKMDEAAKAKMLEAAQRYEKHASSRKEVTNSTQTTAAKGGGGGVEADKNAANSDVMREHGDWMAEQMPKLSGSDVAAINRVLGAEGFKESWPGAAAAFAQIGIDPEKGVSPLAKEYIDRLHRYAEGYGRVQSGAAIGTVENMRFVASATPRPTDTTGELGTRAKLLKKDIDLRFAHMGRPARSTPSATPSIPAGAIMGTQKSTGKRGYMLDGKFHAVE